MYIKLFFLLFLMFFVLHSFFYHFIPPPPSASTSAIKKSIKNGSNPIKNTIKGVIEQTILSNENIMIAIKIKFAKL